jgi:DNA polymerase III subunit epsilon
VKALRDWLTPGRDRPAGRGRWLVVDVETSGLNAAQDRLIAIGALAVTDGAVDLGDAFEVVLRQEAPSAHANIEVHGIGGLEQARGEDPGRALEDFLAFTGSDPLIAWHSAFDAQVLSRAARRFLGRRHAARWIDLAALAPLAWPGRVAQGTALDDWLEALGIPISQRHRAIADCLATAQVFAAFLPHAGRLGAPTAGALASLSTDSRWLGGPRFP